MLQFPRLHQREHFPEFIQRAETPGKHNQRLGELREPQLAHEKIMKHEAELRTDVVIGALFVRQLNTQSDGFSAGFGRATVCRLHDSRASAGADYEAPRMI